MRLATEYQARTQGSRQTVGVYTTLDPRATPPLTGGDPVSTAQKPRPRPAPYQFANKGASLDPTCSSSNPGARLHSETCMPSTQESISAPLNNTPHGATVVITHRIRTGKHAAYDGWLNEIAPLCQASPGHLDWHIVRPIRGLTETYTMVIRFDTEANLKFWLNSSARAELIKKVEPLFVKGDDFFVSSGLDFWFTPPGARAQVPVRWKQYLATWSAIYPLALGVPLGVVPLLKKLGASHQPLLNTFAVTGVVVFMMVYIVMPRYTKLIKRWLFS